MFFVGNSIDVALGFLGRRDGDGNIILSVYILLDPRAVDVLEGLQGTVGAFCHMYSPLS
jgi:hypothetical protein